MLKQIVSDGDFLRENTAAIRQDNVTSAFCVLFIIATFLTLGKIRQVTTLREEVFSFHLVK